MPAAQEDDPKHDQEAKRRHAKQPAKPARPHAIVGVQRLAEMVRRWGDAPTAEARGSTQAADVRGRHVLLGHIVSCLDLLRLAMVAASWLEGDADAAGYKGAVGRAQGR